jgi:hypothetical protein
VALDHHLVGDVGGGPHRDGVLDRFGEVGHLLCPHGENGFVFRDSGCDF